MKSPLPRALPLPLLLSTLLLLPSALAHGAVTKVTLDGQDFKGDIPNGAANPSIIRQISDPSPVKGASNPAISCGPSAGPAALVADANPGSVIQFQWTGADLSNWPHNTGPMLTYMASCGSTTCDQFNSFTAKWFKIQQVGRKSAGGEWAQQDVMNGAPAVVTIPPTLKGGNYLIRHEIIALHLATSLGGAEFYPSCTQLRVGGNQTGGPQPSELVSFPGAYNDNDPGIYDPQVYDTSAPYTFPGPPIAAFASSSSSSPSSPSPTKSTKPSKPSSSPSGTSTDSSSASTGVCQLTKQGSGSGSENVTTGSTAYRPRHISRIMRGLTFGSIH